MSDWEERIAAAEAHAGSQQEIEHEAERRFDAVHAEARARGDAQSALKSEELRTWMARRQETDAAWGAWAMLMDEKTAQHG